MKLTPASSTPSMIEQNRVYGWMPSDRKGRGAMCAGKHCNKAQRAGHGSSKVCSQFRGGLAVRHSLPSTYSPQAPGHIDQPRLPCGSVPWLNFAAKVCSASAPVIWTVGPEHAMLAACTAPAEPPVMLTLQVEVCAETSCVCHTEISRSTAMAFMGLSPRTSKRGR